MIETMELNVKIIAAGRDWIIARTETGKPLQIDGIDLVLGDIERLQLGKTYKLVVKYDPANVQFH